MSNISVGSSVDLSGFVPYTGATADLQMGSQYIWAQGFGGSAEDWGLGSDGSGNMILSGNTLTFSGGSIHSSYLVPYLLIAESDWNFATPGSIGIGDFTGLSSINWSIAYDGIMNFPSAGIHTIGYWQIEGDTIRNWAGLIDAGSLILNSSFELSTGVAMYSDGSASFAGGLAGFDSSGNLYAANFTGAGASEDFCIAMAAAL